MQLGNLKTKTQVYRWYTVILLFIIVALLTYALISALDSFLVLDAGLLVLKSPLQDAVFCILAILALYSVGRRFDPVLAKEDFFTGLYMVGLFAFVVWLVLLYFGMVTAVAVGIVGLVLSPVQHLIGPFYWVILGVVALVTLWFAGRSMLT